VKGLNKKQLLEIIEKQLAQLKKCEEQIEALKAALEAERIENELLRQKAFAGAPPLRPQQRKDERGAARLLATDGDGRRGHAIGKSRRLLD